MDLAEKLQAEYNRIKGLDEENARLKAEINQLNQKIKDQEDYIRKLRRMSKGITGQ